MCIVYPLVDPDKRRKKQPGYWYTNSGHARFTSSSLLLAVTRCLYTPRIRFIFPDPVELTVKIDMTALGNTIYIPYFILSPSY
jgi:hypothetical protein